MISRALLIVNPASRRGARARPAAERALRAAGMSLDVLSTGQPGHATDLVRGAGSQYDAVFVLGGDGTVMETVSALADTGRPVGVLPGGTGNLIAGMLGIPRRLRRAIPMLLGGESVRMDLARFESASVRPGGPAKRLGYLAFAAGIGIDVSMITATSTAWKRRLGVAAYVVSAAHAALRRSEFDVVAEVDGTPLRQRASLAMVVNSGSLFRGAFHIGPSILADDGRLDLCVFSPKSAANVFGIAWRVWRKDFRPHPAMRYLKGTRITLLSEPPREVQADGTLIGWTPATFCVAPLAATFLVPRR